MRTKNARNIDALESAHLADVKSCACVFCDASPPVEAHHPKQGRHYLAISACPQCHAARAWRIGKPNEIDAINETLRRVACLRAGQQQQPAPELRKPRTFKHQERAAPANSKILPRRAA